MISFNPLWKTLVDKGLTKSQLRAKIGCSGQVVVNMGKNKYVDMKWIDIICRELCVKVSDVIEYKEEL